MSLSSMFVPFPSGDFSSCFWKRLLWPWWKHLCWLPAEEWDTRRPGCSADRDTHCIRTFPWAAQALQGWSLSGGEYCQLWCPWARKEGDPSLSSIQNFSLILLLGLYGPETPTLLPYREGPSSCESLSEMVHTHKHIVGVQIFGHLKCYLASFINWAFSLTQQWPRCSEQSLWLIPPNLALADL